ncbi:MAG: redoxin domain-containing protein [Chloroflexi bacterium]|nr:MAG: redoxin domain-containing protein [Chloroflexota bacterium]
MTYRKRVSATPVPQPMSLMRLATLILMLGFATAVFGAQTLIGDFALIDHQGKYHQLSRYGHKDAVVLISQRNNCALIADQLPQFKALRQKWEAQNVAFFMINSSTEDSREAIRQEAEVYDIDFPILIDHTQLVGEDLSLSTAPEIIVINPSSRTVVFRGPLDERSRRRSDEPKPTPLADALARTVAGETKDTVTIAARETDAAKTRDLSACRFSYPQRALHAANHPDYARDVAPILRDNCAHCHRQGGIGPFALDSYMMVRGWSAMMREVLMTKRMPPAQVDPAIGHFSNARYISDKELQTLVHWFDLGSPRGDGEDPLENLEIGDAGWQLGEPDYIVNVPAQEVPATGVLDYRHVEIDLAFTEDKWVKAVHFRPGDMKVMHHLLSYIIPADYDWRANRGTRSQRRFLEGYAPGKTDATRFPENAGVYIPKGYKLSVQLHYTTYGKATVDETQIGLYFHDSPPDYEFVNKSVSQGDFLIPAGATEHKASQQFVFENDILLYGMRPHMHYRGKHFKFKVIYPDNTTEELLSVPNYNFNWQPTYKLTSPKMLPAGSRVIVSGAFDNSRYNPGNPDPTKDISWGAQSWDEMFIGYFAYHELEKNEDKYQAANAE